MLELHLLEFQQYVKNSLTCIVVLWYSHEEIFLYLSINSNFYYYKKLELRPLKYKYVTSNLLDLNYFTPQCLFFHLNDSIWLCVNININGILCNGFDWLAHLPLYACQIKSLTPLMSEQIYHI